MSTILYTLCFISLFLFVGTYEINVDNLPPSVFIVWLVITTLCLLIAYLLNERNEYKKDYLYYMEQSNSKPTGYGTYPKDNQYYPRED